MTELMGDNFKTSRNKSSRSKSFPILERSPRVFKFTADELRKMISPLNDSYTESISSNTNSINNIISPGFLVKSFDDLSVAKPLPIDRSFSDPGGLKPEIRCIVTATSLDKDNFVEAYLTFKDDNHLFRYIIKTHGLEINDISMRGEIVRIGKTKYTLQNWKTATLIFNQIASINYRRKRM